MGRRDRGRVSRPPSLRCLVEELTDHRAEDIASVLKDLGYALYKIEPCPTCKGGDLDIGCWDCSDGTRDVKV